MLSFFPEQELLKYKYFIIRNKTIKHFPPYKMPQIKKLKLDKEKEKLNLRIFGLNVGFCKNSYTLRNFNANKKIVKNWNILNVIQNLKSKENLVNNNFLLENRDLLKCSDFYNKNVLIKISPIYMFLNKEFFLIKAGRKRQFFFIFNQILHSLRPTSVFLLKEVSSLLLKKNYLLEKKKITLVFHAIYSVYFRQKFMLSYVKQDSCLNVIFFKYLTQSILTNNFSGLIKFFFINKLKNIRKTIVENSIFIQTNLLLWEKFGISINTLSHNSTKENLKYKKVFSFFQRRSSTDILKNFLRPIALKRKNTKSFIKNFVWKRKTNFLLENRSGNLLNFVKFFNKNLNLNKREISLQLIYILSRIEEKIEYLEEIGMQKNTLNKLLNLRNLILFLTNEKLKRNRKTNLLLTQESTLFEFRHKTWRPELLKYLKIFLSQNNITKSQQIFGNLILERLIEIDEESLEDKLKRKEQALLIKRNIRLKNKNYLRAIFYKRISFSKLNSKYKKLWPRKFKLNKKIQISTKNVKGMHFLKNKNKEKIICDEWKREYLQVRNTWVGKKLILAEKYMTLQQKKQLLSSWIGRPVDIIFINSLALTKYAFIEERLSGNFKVKNRKSPNKFLSIFDRDFINKYKYIGIYIKDLVRIAFISVYLKKPSFLAKFVAFQLVKLPKNRKETTFIRFLIKAIRTFGAGRPEILGVRVKFKGRVNRWRRTKFILGTRGTFPLHTISERIEQGTAQAINKKGAVGIRIWLRYKNAFAYTLRTHILNYIEYSRRLKFSRLKRNFLSK